MSDAQALIPVEIAAHDLVAQYESIHEEVDRAIRAVLAGGEFERGEELWSFEEEFARACEATHGIGVGTGHAALFVALRALGRRDGGFPEREVRRKATGDRGGEHQGVAGRLRVR